jgi:hypothetical protein
MNVITTKFYLSFGIKDFRKKPMFVFIEFLRGLATTVDNFFLIKQGIISKTLKHKFF